MSDMKELTCSVCGMELFGVLVYVGEAEDWVCETCSGVSEWDLWDFSVSGESR